MALAIYIGCCVAIWLAGWLSGYLSGFPAGVKSERARKEAGDV